MKIESYPSVALEDLFEFSSGLSKSAKEFGFGHPFVTFKDVFYNSYLPSKLTQLANTTASEIEKCSVRRGDVFLTRTSETMDELGTSSVALQDYPNATFNGFTKRLRPKSLDRVVPEYLVYAFRSQAFRQQVTALSTMSTRASLNNEMLARLSIPLPPVETQQRIGETLHALDQKIELNRQMAVTLEEMARAIFKSWFIDFAPVRAKAEGRPTNLPPEIDALFPASFTEGGLPIGWQMHRLGSLCELAYGKALKAEDRRPGAIQVFGSNGEVGRHDEPLAKGPGIIIGRKGNPGTVNWVQSDYFVIDTAFYVVPRELCPSLHFLFHSLQTQDLSSLSADSAVPGLNRNLAYMNEQLLPLPNILTAFEEQVRPLHERQEVMSLETSTLTYIRDTLLPKLLSGDLSLA